MILVSAWTTTWSSRPTCSTGTCSTSTGTLRPKVITEGRRRPTSGSTRAGAPEHRAQRGGGQAARGVRHRADVVRRDAHGLLRHRPARRRHGRQRRARLDVLPVLPAVLRPAVQPHRRTRTSGWPWCGPTTTGTSTSGAARIPAGSSRWPSRRSGIRSSWPTRSAAWRRRAATPSRSRRTPRSSAGRASTATTGIRSGRRCSDEGTVVCLHIGSSSQLTITSIEAPINVMITLQPMNIVQAAADILWSRVMTEFPDVRFALSEGGIGWIPYFLERCDYVYEHHQAWTGQDLADAPERAVPGALHHLLHRRRRRGRPAGARGHRPHHVGVRLPALGLDVAGLTRAAAPSRSAACPTTRSTPSPTRTPCGCSTTTRSA